MKIIDLTTVKKEAWKDIDIRIHQEFLPKVVSLIIHQCAASVLFGMILIALWVIRPEEFGFAANLFLTIVFLLLYILITRGLIDFVTKAMHQVADMALFEQNSLIIAKEKENAKVTPITKSK